MADGYYLGAKSIGLSKLGGRKPCTLLEAARHNRRECMAGHAFNARIDPTRTRENETLLGPGTSAEVVKLAAKVAQDAGVNVARLRRDHCQAVELVFSLPPASAIADGVYFRQCLSWVLQVFPGVAVLSADIHRDEATPHCHVLLSPVVGNRMAGSTLIGRKQLIALRASFWQCVAGPAGLERPRAKMYGASKALAATTVLKHLEQTRDPVLSSPLWTLTRKAIEHEPLPYLRELGIAPQAVTHAQYKAHAT
jgi:hypothetical protein